MSEHRHAKSDYTVGWVCALPHEMAAATCMLDEKHEDLEEQDISDHNSYQLGRIHYHNIVIASLPAGNYGTTPAATVAKDMLRTFPSIRFGLMVGIGGGAPSLNHDIRLGDVVVSKPHGASGGVIQYDRGKLNPGGTFQRTGSLNSPPNSLLTTLTRLQSRHQIENNKIPLFLNEASQNYPRFNEEFAFPGRSHDQLFQANYEHMPSSANTMCEKCDLEAEVYRDPRKDNDPQIHYGNIASSNQVMKDGLARDQLGAELDVLCFEMEAAGLMLDFPCLVIRGICDYSDSHKNKRWQKYAAAVAAGFAKELLGSLSAKSVQKEKAIVQVSDPILHKIASSINLQMQEDAERQELRYVTDQQRACHQALKTSTYEHFKNNNPDRVPGTCRWVLENDKYTQWWQEQKDGLLWISADPGCGKSVLARSLIDNELRSTSTHTICYFFFKDNEEQENLSTALCAVLHQLFSAQPQLLRHTEEPWKKNGSKLAREVRELWRILLTAVMSNEAKSVTVVIDALDECRRNDRRLMIELLHQFYGKPSGLSLRSGCLKILLTSRPYADIEDDFRRVGPNIPVIRLHGELENDMIHEEINLVVRQKVAILGAENDLSRSTIDKLEQKLLKMEHRTYLWLHLTFGEIESAFNRSLQPDSELIESLFLPTSVENAYEKILTRVPKDQKDTVTQIFHIIIGARRPLTTDEMAMALGIHRRRGEQPFVEFKIIESRLRRKMCDLCGLFVFINRSKIYLIHQTAKEFLIKKAIAPVTDIWRYSLNSSESEKMMTRICVDYLSLSEIYDNTTVDLTLPRASGTNYEFFNDDLRTSKRIEQHEIGALLSYSSEHWAAHFRNASFELGDAVISKALELSRVKSKQFQLWFPWMWKTFGSENPPADMNDLMVAAFNGHDIILKIILDTKAVDLKAKDSSICRTTLIWASLGGNKKIVETLLSMGAETNVHDRYGSTALKEATKKGYEKVVKLLLNNGAEVNEDCGDGCSALILASKIGHEKIVQMLLDKGADVNVINERYGNALEAASENGHEKIVHMLLDKGANVNAQTELTFSALQAASANGHEHIVRILLDKGANVNAQNEETGSVVGQASAGGHAKTVKQLLEKGADVNAQIGSFGNALQTASAQGQMDTVQILLDNGADVNARSGYCGYPLLAALKHGHEDIALLLLAKGANVNAQADQYDRALSEASAAGYEKIVKILFEKGGDMTVQRKFHGKAMMWAALRYQGKIATMLLNKSASADELCNSTRKAALGRGFGSWFFVQMSLKNMKWGEEQPPDQE